MGMTIGYVVTTLIAMVSVLCSNWERIVETVAVRNSDVTMTPKLVPDDDETPLLTAIQLDGVVDGVADGAD